MYRQLTLWITLVLLVTSSAMAIASAPPVINYQGKLLGATGVPIADGTYQMRFAIYDSANEGTALWVETNSAVQVKNGLFSVLLGNITPLPADLFATADRWFGVKVGDDVEMVPRQRIATVPLAMTAVSVTDASITTTKIADGAVTADKLAPGVMSGAVPTGAIIMWSGAANTIPAGWTLCDGQNGTPDLRDRFIVGAGGAYPAGENGGLASLNLAHAHTVNDHTHNANHTHGCDVAGDHSHHMDFWTQGSPDRANYYDYAPDGYTEVSDEHRHQVVGDTWGAGNHAHGIQGANFNTGGASNRGMDTQLGVVDNRPPYFAMCFIMKVAN